MALIICMTMLPATALAADYTETKLNINTEIVANYNGYALTGELNEYGYYEWDSRLLDSAGKTAFSGNVTSFTSDGHYLVYNKLYDNNFNLVLDIDLYKITHGGQEAPAWSGGGYDITANGGVIAVYYEPLYFVDYSGNTTGSYMPDTLHVDPYAAGRGVNIGSDGIITIWLGQYAGEGDEYKWVVLDKTGKVLADLGDKYSNVGTFNEGLAYAFVPTGDGEYSAYYIDTSGQIQFAVDAIGLGLFSDGYALAVTGTWESPLYGVIDKTGKWVITPQYEDISNLSQGVFAAKKDGKYGYIDISRNVLVPFEYDDISVYDHGIGYGVKNGELYAIAINSAAVPDVPSDWAIPEVNAAIEAGLVPSMLQKNYQKEITRGEVAQMFINLIEKASGMTIDAFMESKGATIDDNAFTDTDDRAVLAANALEIINGVGDNRFDPDGVFSRAHIAVIINRVARVLGIDTGSYTHSFIDVQGHWANPELGWPVYAKIINGEGDNRFNPEGRLTTEMAILVTYRALAPLANNGIPSVNS